MPPLQLKLIEEKKKRNATCRKRIAGLQKKLFQLSTLCDTQGFLICYDSAGNLHTWPENSQQIQQTIARYNGLDTEKRNRNKLDLSSLLTGRIKKMQSDLDRKKVGCGSHPTIDEVDLELSMARERLDKKLEEKCDTEPYCDNVGNADDASMMMIEPLSYCDPSWLDTIEMIGNDGAGKEEGFTDLAWFDDPWFAGSGFPSSSSKECFGTIDVGDYDIDVW